MKALVTGGTGFVGPYLRLLNNRLYSHEIQNVLPKIGHLAGDVIGWNPMEGPATGFLRRC